MGVIYKIEPNLGPDEFTDLLRRSSLAARRPVDEPDTVRAMLANASVIVTARRESRLIGVSRAISDLSYCTYLSDLAVDAKYQRQGVGKELVRLTHETAGLGTTLILLAAPAAESFYPHIGMKRHGSCWILPRVKPE